MQCPGREASSTICAMGPRDPQDLLESGDPMVLPGISVSQGRLVCQEHLDCRDLSDQLVIRENVEMTEFPASQEMQERMARLGSRVPTETSVVPAGREPQDTRENKVWQVHQEREAVPELQERRDTLERKEIRATSDQLVRSALRELQDLLDRQDSGDNVVSMAQLVLWEILVWTDPKDKWVCAAHLAQRV